MRTLSPTLLAAQQANIHTPCVKVEVKNNMAGVMRLAWQRLYQGTETEYYHSMTLAGDGSLIRVRITLVSDGCKLYRQRVNNPGPQSDFSVWTYTNQYNCLAVTVASDGAEVSIFWINNNREIKRLKSSNYGVSWNSPELLDYSISVNVHGLTAAYKPNGDLTIFFADQTVIYVKKCVGGTWQTKSAWSKNTGTLSSVAAIYTGNDWDLMVTGQDIAGNYKVWSLIYGDGGDVAAGVWSSLSELASAPAGGDYEFGEVFLDKPDVFRAFYVEKFHGVQGYNRPYWSNTILDTGFIDNSWREPVPFDLSGQYGMAIGHTGDYAWLSNANGVWRSSLVESGLEVTSDIVSLKQESLTKDGRLIIELRNDDGRYHSPGEGNLAILKPGSQLEFSPGYITPQGNEISPGLVFWLDGWEHTSSGGKSRFLLRGIDGWRLLEDWRARHQFRWNKDSNEMSVKQMLTFVLARVGLKLEMKSQSPVVTSFYPDFTINPDDAGKLIVLRLLSFVPDLLFIEGIRAYLVNPQIVDPSVYSYGPGHPVLHGNYYSGSWQTNQVRIEGFDTISGSPIITDVFSWEQLGYFSDRVKQVTDRNIGTAVEGQTLAEAILRKAEIESLSGMITVPVNCGQQLYDVIDITDSRTGLAGAKRRVMGLVMSYRPERGEYEQTLSLAGV